LEDTCAGPVVFQSPTASASTQAGNHVMRARTNLSVLSTITCLLVILVGSIQAPFFLVASTQGEGNWALPGFQASTTLSHDALYAKSKLEAESWGLPPPFRLDYGGCISWPRSSFFATVRHDSN